MEALNNWEDETIFYIRNKIWEEQLATQNALHELDGKLKAGDRLAMQQVRKLNGHYQGLTYVLGVTSEMLQDNREAEKERNN